MPDETFDAVIIGGGNQALYLAMYLAKYAGMSVGVFERRHELGGGLTTEEIAAGGFRGNTHAVIQLPWYHLPLWRDFPEYWDYGAQIDQHLCSDGAVFRNNQTCLAIYSEKHDPDQERTAKEIARFSERDAEKWLKLRKNWGEESVQRVEMDMLFNPAELRGTPEMFERQLAIYPLLVEAGVEPDSLILASNFMRVAREFWESPELQYCAVRFALSSAFDVNQPGLGTVIKIDDSSSFVILKKVRLPEPKKLDEARGQITSDYQNYLEEEWLKALKQKYPVEVDKSLLSRIKP